MENVLVAPGAAPPRVWLVDWEMGGSGERAWDVGCFAASGVSAWLASIPAVPDIAPGRLVAEAGLPMDAILPGLDAFWAAYRAAGPRAPTPGWAMRCAQLAAVRLVHLAFDRSAHVADLHPLAVGHLQVATHILADPRRAGRGSWGSHDHGDPAAGGGVDPPRPRGRRGPLADELHVDGGRGQDPEHVVRLAGRPGIRRALVEAIRGTLYDSFYTGAPRRAAAAADTASGGSPVDVTRLDAANAGAGCLEPGWRVVGEEDGRRVVQRGGLRLWVADKEIEAGRTPRAPATSSPSGCPRAFPGSRPASTARTATAASRRRAAAARPGVPRPSPGGRRAVRPRGHATAEPGGARLLREGRRRSGRLRSSRLGPGHLRAARSGTRARRCGRAPRGARAPWTMALPR